jgi:hypothetical protein
MRFIFILCGLLSLAYGVMVLHEAKSSFHQIYGSIWLIIAAITIGAGFILDAAKQIRKSIERLSESDGQSGPPMSRIEPARVLTDDEIRTHKKALAGAATSTREMRKYILIIAAVLGTLIVVRGFLWEN